MLYFRKILKVKPNIEIVWQEAFPNDAKIATLLAHLIAFNMSKLIGLYFSFIYLKEQY